MCGGGYCGKCDYNHMIEQIECTIASNYVQDLFMLNPRMQYCSNCGTQVTLESTDIYYMQYSYQIAENIGEAIDALEISIYWFKNFGYVNSRIKICEESLKVLYRYALEEDYLKYTTHKISRITQHLVRLNDLLERYNEDNKNKSRSKKAKKIPAACRRDSMDLDIELQDQWINNIKYIVN